jgi:hypothetical protein
MLKNKKYFSCTLLILLRYFFCVVFFGEDHRDSAAFLAISFLFRADNLSARARPPIKPPLRPISERYLDISDFSGAGVSGSSVERRKISYALLLESFGSGLLDRLMHP